MLNGAAICARAQSSFDNRVSTPALREANRSLYQSFIAVEDIAREAKRDRATAKITRVTPYFP
jgi:hypothetical protein